jgi:hypothetical protein
VSLFGGASPPGEGPPVPIAQEAGWAPELVWTQRLEEISFASAGDRTPVAQSLVRHFTERVTEASWKGIKIAYLDFSY